MPELPEVETVKKGLAPYMEGERIENLALNRGNLRWPFQDDLRQLVQGQSVTALSRRAKYIMIEMANDVLVVVHLGMSGSFRIYESEAQYIPQKHDHVVFTMHRGAVLAFNDPRRFGMVWAIPKEELLQHASFKNLGPEPFGDAFTAAYLYGALQSRKTPIKTALLDQGLVAGLGNIYVCEALFHAGISPERRANGVSEVEAKALHATIIDVLARAIEAGGSTLRDHKKTDGTMGYFQHSFAVYGREGDRCADCSCDVALTGGVQRIAQSGRSSFYCPQKQV